MAHRLRIPFPPPFSIPSQCSCCHVPGVPPVPWALPLSPTRTMEPQRLALPSLNSTPHQLTAITPPPPLDSGNRRLQAEALTPAMKSRSLALPPTPIKRQPRPWWSTLHPNSPSPTLYCAHAIAISSQSSTIGAPPLTTVQAPVSGSLDAPSWPEVAASTSSGELHGRPW
jgi:hypothetical protein